MSVYKSIFVSDEFEGLEAGAQVQGIDGSVRVFGETAFSTLEQAVAAVNTKAVIARVASGKYDYFVADGNGNFNAADQVVYVNFNGGSGLSYDNGEYSRSVDMIPASFSASEQADVVSALNDLNAESGVVFTSAAPAGAVYSTVYVGGTNSFDDLGNFKGLSESVDVGNLIPNDEAFVNTNNIASVDELIEVIDHEAGHLMGEEHPVSTGTIIDFADPEYVAQIGETKYETLSAAYAAAQSGDTIKLLVSEISSIAGIPAGVTIEGVEGMTSVSSTVSGHMDNITLRNIKFTASSSAMRWCYLEAGNTFIIENCEFAQGGAYGIHFDGNNKGDVIVRNSILKSWNSFADSLNSVSVDNCIIDAGSYAMFRPYVNTTFTNCQFTEAYAGFVDTSEGSGVELFGENVVMELSGCSIIKSKDDPTVSTEYTVKDLIVRQPYGDIGSTNMVGVKSNTSVIAVDPVKDGEGKYTAGVFFANTAAAIDANLAAGSLSGIVGSSRGLVYDLTNAEVTVEGTVAGTITLDGSIDFKAAAGATYASGTVINIDASGVTGELVKIFDTAADNLPTDGSVTFNITGGGDAYNAVVIDGDLYLQEKPYVAQIGETKYHTLSAAYAAAQSGDTIKILVAEISGEDFNSMPSTLTGITIEGVEGKTRLVPPYSTYGQGNPTTGIAGKTFADCTIRNISFTGAQSGVRDCSVSTGTLTFENCDFTSSWSYSLNFGGGKGTLVVKDSYVAGWSSFTNSLSSVNFENCIIDSGAEYGSDRTMLRPYTTATLTGCSFTEAFAAIDGSSEYGIYFSANNTALEMYDCKVVKSKDDPTISEKYAVKDLIYTISTYTSVAAIDPVKNGDGKYTNGFFITNYASTLDSRLATPSLAAIAGNSIGLGYNLPVEGNPTLEMYGVISGTFNVPENVEVGVGDGIIYDNATLTGSIHYNIKDAQGSVTISDAVMSGSKISNTTADATTAFVNTNSITDSTLQVTGTVTNTGTLTIDPTANISAGSFSGSTGTITVDLTGFEGTSEAYLLIDAGDNAGVFGTVNFVGSDLYEASVVGGDLYMKLAASPEIQPATENHTGVGEDDVQITAVAGETSVAGNVSTENGTVNVQNVADSNLVVGNITADKDVTVEAAAGANDTMVGNIESNQDVNVTNSGDGTMQLSDITAGGDLSLVNNGGGDMSISGDTVAEILEIRNETDNELSHSGKLAARDVNIYNNENDDQKVGEITITQQIEAAGDISINNNSMADGQSGVIDLGTQEHSAQGGLNIVNKENNVINGGGSEAGGDEQAANITVKEDVTITNDGHLNANITTDGDLVITNSSVNTLIGDYTAANITLSNDGGAHDVTFTATTGNVVIDNTVGADPASGVIDNVTINAANGYAAISGNGTTTNATINTDTLYMGGTTLEITDGTILDADSTIFLAVDENLDPVAGADLTITGDHTVGTRITATYDDVLYGTVTMNGTQTYTGDIEADAFVVAAGADVTIDNTASNVFDFNTLTITGTLTTDFDAQSSYSGAGAVTGAGNLKISTDGEWIVNDSVYRDFSGFTGNVSMTRDNAEITMGIGDAPAATPLVPTDSYFADGVEMTTTATQSINLKGADVTTGIVFTGAGTLNVFEDQTLSANNSIAVTQVSEGKTLTLTGDTFTGNITLDKDPNTDITTLKLNNAGLVVTGGITGDTDDVIDVAASAELDAAASLDAFAGAVTITPAAATLTLSGENDTAAAFYGAGTIALTADQTFSADGALDNFTGTAAVGTSELTLGGENATAALFTGTTGTITAAANQQLISDGALNGFAGTVAMGANVLTLDGENTTAAAFAGSNAIIANADQTLSGDISGFTGTITADTTNTATVTISGTVADTLNLAGYTVVLADAVSHATPITVNADTTLATLTANDNNIALGTGTFSTVTSTSGNIDLSGYTVGTLGTVTSSTGAIKIASAQNITVSTALDGNLAYTVTAAQTDDTADVAFTGGALTYADAMTVTAADNYFATPYKLLSAGTLTIDDSTFTFTLTVGTDSGTIEVGNMAKIGDTFYQLSLVGDAGVEQALVLTAFNGTSNTVYVNNTDAAWIAATPYEQVSDTFYSDPADYKERNIGYDAAASIDNAIGYIKADETGTDAGKGWIELTESVNYSISTALGTTGATGNGVTDMTLRSRSTAEYAAAGNAKVTGDINAGAATTLNLENISATGSVYGAGTVNITGVKANRFSGTNIAAGGELNITGGTYTARYIAGGTYNVDGTAASTVTINGAADRTSISGTVYGGSIASGTGIAVTQDYDALVVVQASDKIYLAGNIYAAGLARSGATLTVNGNREVIFRGTGANLSFTGRVSGAAQGGTIAGGTATLNFNNFTGKFNGSISDFDTVTISAGTALELGRRQTLTANTGLKYAVTSESVAGTSMYTVRDKNAWEFAQAITVEPTFDAASGTYVLVDNYAAGFDGFTFTVAGDATYQLGQTVEDVAHNLYTLNYQSEKLTLTYVNLVESAIITDPADQDAEEKVFVIYNTDVNGATLANDANVETISATEGTTVVFNDDSYSTKLDANAAGALIYKDSTSDEIVWVGNAETATVDGNLSGSSMDISGKELTVNAADIDDLVVDKDATLNLTSGASTIDTISMAAGTNLTFDVGSGATVSSGTGAITITGSNGTVTINNEGTLTAQVTSAGTVVITNTSTNSLYGEFGGAGTELISLDNTGKVADASFTAEAVTLNDAVNATTGRLGFYQNITVTADVVVLDADLSGWDLAADVNFPGAIYNFAAGAVSAMNFTIDAGTSFGGATAVAAVTGADLTSTVFSINGTEIDLGDTVTVDGVDYEFTVFNGDAYFFQGSAPTTDKETIVVDQNAVDYVVYEGKTYTVGVNAFNTVSDAMAARTEDTDTLIVIQATDSVGGYTQGYKTTSLELAKVTGSLTAKNYFVGDDKQDPWEGETFNATDTLVIEAGASLLTPAVQDNTAIYVRATGEVIADEGSVIGIQPNNIVNLLNYGKVTLNGTTAYLDGFANYGVDLNDNPETLGKAEFNAINSTINVKGTLLSSHCNQYTVAGIQTAALIGGKNGKGDATANLTDTDMTIETNFIVGFKKNGTLNVDGGSVTVGGTVGVGLDAGNGVITMTGADLTAGVISVGSNGSITLDTDSLITAASLTNSGSITIDAANFAGGYQKVIDLNQGSALSDIELINAAEGVSLSYAADGDVYVVDSSALTKTFFVSADWSGLEPGAQVEVIPGVNGTIGENAFSSLDDAFNVYGDHEHRNTEIEEIVIMSDLTSTGTGKQFFFSDVDVAITADASVSVDMSSHSRVYFMGYYDVTEFEGAPETVPTFTIGENVNLIAGQLMAGQAIDYPDDVDGDGNATRDPGAAHIVINGTVNTRQNYATAYSTIDVIDGGKLLYNPELYGYGDIMRACGTINIIGDGTKAEVQYSPGYMQAQNGTLNVKDTWVSTGTVLLQDQSEKDANFSPERSGDSTIIIDNSKFDSSVSMSLQYAGAKVILKNGSEFTVTGGVSNLGSIEITDSSMNIGGTLTNERLFSADKDSSVIAAGLTNKANAAITGDIAMTSGNNTLTMDVDSILNGAVDMGEGNDTVAVTGVKALAESVSGSKALVFGGVSNAETYKIDNVEVELFEKADLGDDVWAQLSTSDGSLVVSWGRNEAEVTAALDAFNEQKNDLAIGQAVVADAVSLNDGIDASDYQKKNNGTLA